jgi:hypothetical protein
MNLLAHRGRCVGCRNCGQAHDHLGYQVPSLHRPIATAITGGREWGTHPTLLTNRLNSEIQDEKLH